MRRVWDVEIAPKLDDDELAFRFGAVIDAMHSANHRLDDGINKDREVDVATRKLEQYVNGRYSTINGANPAER
jgi:hypothetical protein